MGWKKNRRRTMSARDEIAVEVLNANEKSSEGRGGQKYSPASSDSSCCSEDIMTYINVAVFAVFGCLIRIGLDRLVGSTLANIESPESVIFQSFFSNMLGSFILGLLVASSLKKIPGMTPVYTGISTGLCGSITTYSKFNQQVSTMLIGEASPDGQNQVIAAAQVAIGIAAPLCSLMVGKDVAHGIRKRLAANRYDVGGDGVRPKRRSSAARWINGLAPILLLASWGTLLAMCIVHSDQNTVLNVCLCGVFAPFGAIIRYLLGKFNGSSPGCLSSSACLKEMPLGTFLANFLGAMLIAICHVIITWADLTCVGIASLKAIQSGFLACLTTVSTFVNEIATMRSKSQILASHGYAFLTILLCQIVAGIINGASYGVYLNSPPEASNLTCTG